MIYSFHVFISDLTNCSIWKDEKGRSAYAYPPSADPQKLFFN